MSVNQVNSIIEFATFNNLRILYNEKVATATVDNIRNMIRESDAFKYLNNPEEFLNNLQ